ASIDWTATPSPTRSPPPRAAAAMSRSRCGRRFADGCRVLSGQEPRVLRQTAPAEGVRMRIAMVGSGGVGGLFGARLVQSGNEVVFLARGAHLEALRAGGLRLESAHGDLHLPRVAAEADPAAVGPAGLG